MVSSLRIAYEDSFMYYGILSLFLGILAFFDIGSTLARASSYSSCANFYTAAAPGGYGSAYDEVFGGLHVSVNCNTKTVTVGAGDQRQYVHEAGYIYAKGAWQQPNLTSSSVLQSRNWYIGSAQANLGSVDLRQTTYVVGYACDWTGSVWKRDCGDSVCAAPIWQLEAVKRTAAQQDGRVSLSASPKFGPKPLTVNFTASGGLTNRHLYHIDFGDGRTSIGLGPTSRQTSHSFVSTGTYIAKLMQATNACYGATVPCSQLEPTDWSAVASVLISVQ
jgi:hypothetical protein